MKTTTKREFNSTLNQVKVMFLDKKYNYETDVSASSTLKSVKDYFVGKYFNVGTYPKENMQKCTKIIFYKNPKNQPKTKLNAPMKIIDKNYSGLSKGKFLNIFHFEDDTIVYENEDGFEVENVNNVYSNRYYINLVKKLNQPKTKLNAPMKAKTTPKKKTVRGLKTVCNRVIKQQGLKVDGTLRKGWHYVNGKPTKTVAKKKTTTKRKVAAKKTTKKKSGLLGLGFLGIL